MMWLVSMLLLSASVASAQGFPFPGPGRAVWGGVGGGGGGFDYTTDPNFLGCWGMTSTDTELAFETDNCTADAVSDTMSWSGTYSSRASAPAGASHTLSGEGDGSSDYMLIADTAGSLDRFEVADFTIGCWYVQDGPTIGSDYVFSKDDLTAWELVSQSSGTAKFEVQNEPELTASVVAADVWQHRLMRYDGSGTSDDAVDDTLEVFTNGVADCAGGCKVQTTSPVGNAGDMTIMSQSSGSASKLLGAFHECFYADRVLTNAEVKEIYLCGVDGGDNGTTRAAAYTSGAACTVEGCCL